MNTQRTHRRVDWVSDFDYEMGIIRVGRVSFPGSWAVIPYILYSIIWIAFGLSYGFAGQLDWVLFWIASVPVVVPLSVLAFYGTVPLVRRIRESIRSTLEDASDSYDRSTR